MSDGGDMSRKFKLEVTKDGAVFIRETGQGKRTGGLPVYSTDTREEAKSLQVRHCRLARDGSGIYRLNEFGGDIDDLFRVGHMFKATHAEQLARASEAMATTGRGICSALGPCKFHGSGGGTDEACATIEHHSVT